MATFYGADYGNARTAKELLEKYPFTADRDGYYLLYPNGRGNPGQLVYCDMTTDGGGWMMVTHSHPSVVNYNGQNWGWKGGKIGNIQDFSQAYQAGWQTYWGSVGNTFTEYIFGNQRTNFDNSWGPFIYKVSNINYTTFLTSDTQQGYTKSTIKSDTNVYGTTSYPGMQGAIGFTDSATSSNFYYMRDCCGLAGYGGFATQMSTVYCGANFYYSGPWCGGSTTTNGVYDNNSYVENNLTYGGTNQYMIMVR